MSDEIPEEWSEKALKHFCVGVRGVSYKPQDLHQLPSSNTVTLLRSNNIQDPGLVLRDVQYVNNSKVKSVQLARPKDLAVCMSNGSRRLVGKSSSFRAIPEKSKYTVGAFCSIFRPTDNVHPDFVEQLFKSNKYVQQVELSLAGSAINNLKNSDMEEYRFLCPPKPEQQKIASILTSVDEVIEKTESQINKIQDLKKGMMQELLTRGIGHTEFKDSPVGRIPKGWECVQLKDVTRKFQNGYAFSASGYMERGIPIISMALIGLDGNFNKDYKKTKFWDKEARESLNRYLVKNGDLLIAMTDVTPTMELIGRCCIADIPGESLLNQRVGLISLNQDKLYKYFFAYFSNHGYWRSYSKGVSGLGAQANIGTSQILDGWVALPPLSEQQEITSSIKSVDDLIATQTSVVESKKKIKKALMQDLLTGKVRVKTD